MQKIDEMCDLGVHANLIVPPSWVVKLPPKRVSHFFFICLNLNCSCPPQTPHFVSEHVYHASLSIFSWMVLFFRILILIVQNKSYVQFKLLLEIKFPVVLFPLIHCFDCISVCYKISIMHFWVSHSLKKTVKSWMLSILSLCAIFYA